MGRIAEASRGAPIRACRWSNSIPRLADGRAACEPVPVFNYERADTLASIDSGELLSKKRVLGDQFDATANEIRGQPGNESKKVDHGSSLVPSARMEFVARMGRKRANRAGNGKDSRRRRRIRVVVLSRRSPGPPEHHREADEFTTPMELRWFAHARRRRPCGIRDLGRGRIARGSVRLDTRGPVPENLVFDVTRR
jgi:hypothetical protein